MREENTAVSVAAENPLVGSNILVVDDELLFAKAVCKKLQKAGVSSEYATTLAQAKQKLKVAKPDLILLDMRLPDGSGLEFLQTLRAGEYAQVAVVVLTAYGELNDAVAAMKMRALDYLKKPIDLDELLTTLEEVFKRIERKKHVQNVQGENEDTQAVKKQEVQLLGDSTAIAQIRQQIGKIALLTEQAHAIPPTVLILGETGTGKDLAARYLHHQSQRRKQRFVHIDCASLPKELIEAELFGHEKGAFTNAHQTRIGLIEEAGRGTVFLDEIGELPLDVQAKLLAVLERRNLRRVGSSQERKIEAWFLAASNRDLQAMVAKGEFRSDLYFRLQIMTMQMPALRERGNDVLLLAKHFAQQTSQRYGVQEVEFNESAQTVLSAYSWPGNVRELVNVIERAVILHQGQTLLAEDLQLNNLATENTTQHFIEPSMPLPADANTVTLEDAEAAMIRQALVAAEGNVSQAARQLGITRMTMRYRMQKYGIDR